MRKSIVISYDEQSQQLVVGTLPNTVLAPMLGDALSVNWPLDRLGYELTDDTALRLGTTALSVLTLHNPELKPMLKVTPLPMPAIPKSD